MLLYGLLLLGILAIVYGPQLWVQAVFRRYGGERQEYPGTAAELARHLLDRAGLEQVRVDVASPEFGDHYDPTDKAVRLMPTHHDGRSLTAVTIAAHEVGHALQDAQGYKPLHWRTMLVRWIAPIDKVGSVFLTAAPFLLLLVKSPAVFVVTIAIGIGLLLLSVIVHAVTLPMEFHASFQRALPILERGGYLPHTDLPGARMILSAAALTYVAAALVNVLNIWRLFRLLR